MIILGIETSCDETAAAILEQKNGRIQILSNVVASSALLQAKYGGIIPEQAAREQIRSIIPVIETAINNSQLTFSQIDAIAVTYGPGLIGSLLVGVETAKVLAKIYNKPLIPINHLLGHFYANWIDQSSVLSSQLSDSGLSDNQITGKLNSDNRKLKPDNQIPSFPSLGLLVSGGHTDLVLFTAHGKYQYLGGTRDDAAGECFDKCARLLGLPYPGGPQISKLAKGGNAKAFNLPRPMISSKDFDFSFSGLKTAVANLVKSWTVIPAKAGIQKTESTWIPQQVRNDKISNLSASIEQAIIDVLVYKTIRALQQYKVKSFILAGGVAANQKLCDYIALTVRENFQAHIVTFIPKSILCTDNAAMIASAAFFIGKKIEPEELQANPNLSLAHP